MAEHDRSCGSLIGYECTCGKAKRDELDGLRAQIATLTRERDEARAVADLEAYKRKAALEQLRAAHLEGIEMGLWAAKYKVSDMHDAYHRLHKLDPAAILASQPTGAK